MPNTCTLSLDCTPKPKQYTLNLQMAHFPEDEPNSVRIFAVDDNGRRIPDGNIVKFTPGKGIYRYFTINPELPIALTQYGQCPVLDANPDSSPEHVLKTAREADTAARRGVYSKQNRQF